MKYLEKMDQLSKIPTEHEGLMEHQLLFVATEDINVKLEPEEELTEEPLEGSSINNEDDSTFLEDNLEVVLKEQDTQVQSGAEDLLQTEAFVGDVKHEFLQDTIRKTPTEHEGLMDHQLLFVATEDIEVKLEQESQVQSGAEDPLRSETGVRESNHEFLQDSIGKVGEEECNLEDTTRNTSHWPNLTNKTDSLAVHLKTHSNDTNHKPFACNQCSYRAAQRSNLVRHFRSHTDEKPYACNQCSYKSALRSTLVTHMRTHTNDKPYACNKCSYRAAQHSALVRHMRTHTNEKPFACDQCSFRAAQRGTLLTHMITHTYEKRFACDQCSYRSAHHNTLVTHMRTHTNEKRFACNQCSFTAARRSNLVTHLRTHTNEKPFACNQCSYRSAQHSALVRHIRTHTNEKPFACSQCSFRAAQRSNLVTHMRTHPNAFACIK